MPIISIADMENDSEFGMIALRYAGEDQPAYDAWVNDLKNMHVYDAWRGGMSVCYLIRNWASVEEFNEETSNAGCPIVTIDRLPNFKSSEAIFRNLHRRIWGTNWDRQYEDGQEITLEIKPRKIKIKA